MLSIIILHLKKRGQFGKGLRDCVRPEEPQHVSKYITEELAAQEKVGTSNCPCHPPAPTPGPEPPSQQGFCEHNMEPLMKSNSPISYIGKLRPNRIGPPAREQ